MITFDIFKIQRDIEYNLLKPVTVAYNPRRRDYIITVTFENDTYTNSIRQDSLSFDYYAAIEKFCYKCAEKMKNEIVERIV